ncbi:MAG TPA: FG-GAP repeat protein [Polyangiaceae bacterium]|nr:FG-GAP repeat protein [Polyangiaceae bacterium]
MRLRMVSSAVLGFAAVACSWGRFDDVADGAPVVVLEKPRDVRSGFGSALAAATRNGRAALLVGGTPGASHAALFDLGRGELPVEHALMDDLCSSDRGRCFLTDRPAALPRVVAPSGLELEFCFAVGAGAFSGQAPGVLVECESRDRFTIPVPEALDAALRSGGSQPEPQMIALAAVGAPEPGLLAGSEQHGLAWYYPEVSAAPIDLVPVQGWEPGFGASVAAAPVGEERLLAVGSPASGRVHLFRTNDDGVPRPAACVEAGPGFGRSLALGPLTAGDDEPELLVGDGHMVTVLEVAPLLEGAADPCVRLEDAAEVAHLACRETGEVTGCSEAELGSTLVLGDIDGDGDNEVLAGAPGLTVRGIARAGAIVVYDVEGPGDAEPVDVKFLSSAQNGDELGRGLAAARVGARDIIAAGAPGSARAALFYCPALPAVISGSRCR